MSAQHTYLLLGLAIVAEVIATSALKASAGFTRLGPSLLTVAGYGLAFWLLSLTLRQLPTGVVYAIWSGVGIVLITLVGWLWFKEPLDAPALIGLGLIISGVAVLNLFSKSVPH
jgi:small multidrug resistance pump